MKNLKDAMLPINYWSWKRSFSKLPKSCQCWELTFLLTAAFRATKILSTVAINILVDRSFQSYQISTTLRADVAVAFIASKNLEDAMLPVNYWSWKRSFLELPNSYQRWGLTFLSTAAFRTTKNLKDAMLPVNNRSWQYSFLELPKSCHQWELTLLSTIAFIATKISTTLRVDVPIASRAT